MKNNVGSVKDAYVHTEYLYSELLGFWTSSIVRIKKKLENTMFRKLDLLSSSGKAGDTYSVGFLSAEVNSF
jgi:hypothetical protein